MISLNIWLIAMVSGEYCLFSSYGMSMVTLQASLNKRGEPLQAMTSSYVQFDS